MCVNHWGGYHCEIPPKESCLVFTTTENQGDIFIQLEFNNQPDQDFGEVFIADGESWSHCFPSEDLVHFSVQNLNGNSWVGEVSFTHSDDLYESPMTCYENCDCACDGLSEDEYLDNGCGECIPGETFSLGIDNDEDVDGNLKCRFGEQCLFEVSWNIKPEGCSASKMQSCNNTCSASMGHPDYTCKCMENEIGEGECFHCQAGKINYFCKKIILMKNC